jgi:hypothetical protein
MERCLFHLKDDIEKIRKKIMCNFNILNDNGGEWDNLQSQVQEYTKKHEIKDEKISLLIK